MDISLILTILGSILGPMVLIYFWLRDLRSDIISHVDEFNARLDKHIDEAKQEGTRKYNLLIQLNGRMDKLYQCVLKKLGQIP